LKRSVGIVILTYYCTSQRLRRRSVEIGISSHKQTLAKAVHHAAMREECSFRRMEACWMGFPSTEDMR